MAVWWDTPVSKWVPGKVLEDGLRRDSVYVAFDDGNYKIEPDFQWYLLSD